MGMTSGGAGTSRDAIVHETMRLVDGHRVAYRSAGTGSWALVCVHGLGQSGVMWERAIERLPAEWSGYALDLLGFGASDKPIDGYSIEFHARAVRQFVEGLAVPNVVLAANSLGGVIALRVALASLPVLRGLVLVATGPRVRDPEKLRQYRQRLATMELDLEQRRAMARGYCFTELDPAMIDRIADEIGKASRTAMLETMASSLATNLIPDLPRVQLPTLVVQGREDQGRPPEDGLDIVRGIPDATLIVLPSAGHTPMLDAPAEFQLHLNSVLEQWRRAAVAAA